MTCRRGRRHRTPSQMLRCCTSRHIKCTRRAAARRCFSALRSGQTRARSACTAIKSSHAPGGGPRLRRPGSAGSTRTRFLHSEHSHQDTLADWPCGPRVAPAPATAGAWTLPRPILLLSTAPVRPSSAIAPSHHHERPAPCMATSPVQHAECTATAPSRAAPPVGLARHTYGHARCAATTPVPMPWLPRSSLFPDPQSTTIDTAVMRGKSSAARASAEPLLPSGWSTVAQQQSGTRAVGRRLGAVGFLSGRVTCISV